MAFSRDPHWYIGRHPCPGADPDELYRLVAFLIRTVSRGMLDEHPAIIESNEALAKASGLTIDFLLGDDLAPGDSPSGGIDEDGPAPGSEGAVRPR